MLQARAEVCDHEDMPGTIINQRNEIVVETNSKDRRRGTVADDGVLRGMVFIGCINSQYTQCSR